MDAQALAVERMPVLFAADCCKCQVCFRRRFLEIKLTTARMVKAGDTLCVIAGVKILWAVDPGDSQIEQNEKQEDLNDMIEDIEAAIEHLERLPHGALNRRRRFASSWMRR